MIGGVVCVSYHGVMADGVTQGRLVTILIPGEHQHYLGQQVEVVPQDAVHEPSLVEAVFKHIADMTRKDLDISIAAVAQRMGLPPHETERVFDLLASNGLISLDSPNPGDIPEEEM